MLQSLAGGLDWVVPGVSVGLVIQAVGRIIRLVRGRKARERFDPTDFVNVTELRAERRTSDIGDPRVASDVIREFVSAHATDHEDGGL